MPKRDQFPRAVIHIDGDSFFVSCELTKRPDLRGRPVVTGEERGIATAMSPEAKRLGITRAMPIDKIRREFPNVTVLSSDYASYGAYSRRMTDIVRRYADNVEEYSIDECFAELTGSDRALGKSYEAIAASIKHDLQAELGMTFSVGLSVNKVLAKAASSAEKPDGFMIVPFDAIADFLRAIAIKKIWGIGPHTALYLEKLGIRTARELAEKDFEFVSAYLAKPTIEIWRELRGEHVLALSQRAKDEQKSVMHTRTFKPPTSDRTQLAAELSRNAEGACARLRECGLYAREVSFYLKSQTFRHFGMTVPLAVPVCVPEKILAAIMPHVGDVYKNGTLYRATGVVLTKLVPRGSVVSDLFGEFKKAERLTELYAGVDRLSAKFGRAVISLGSSQNIRRVSRRARLPLPFLGKVR